MWADMTTSTQCNPIGRDQVKKQGGQWVDIMINRPASVTFHNKFMGGVDNLMIKSVKWWKYLFWFFLDAAIVNSFNIYSESPDTPKLSHLHFCSKLSKELIGNHVSQGSSRSKSRAAKRLEPYNKSLKTLSSVQSGEDRVADRSARGESNSNSRTRSSPPNASSDPPDWAKKLLRQQQANATKLKPCRVKWRVSSHRAARNPTQQSLNFALLATRSSTS
ncbi:hypothetical protein ACROYT_G016739 [Oculina patagonica]